MLPSQPTNLFPRPFADSGNKQIIPDSQAATGRASCQDGFPPETQLPLSQGGIAPNRTDFNGILFMLSAFAHWQQSGGLWTWRNDLDYQPPAMVYHVGNFWICLKANGPSTAAGATEPGTNVQYWQGAFDYLAAAALAAGGGIPDDIGTATRSRDIGNGKYLRIQNGRVAGVDLPARVDDIGTTTRVRDIGNGTVLGVQNGRVAGVNPNTIGGDKQDAYRGAFDTIGSYAFASWVASRTTPEFGSIVSGSSLRVAHIGHAGDDGSGVTSGISLPGSWISLITPGWSSAYNIGLFRRVA